MFSLLDNPFSIGVAVQVARTAAGLSEAYNQYYVKY